MNRMLCYYSIIIVSCWFDYKSIWKKKKIHGSIVVLITIERVEWGQYQPKIHAL